MFNNFVGPKMKILQTRDLRFAYNNGPEFIFPDISCDASGHLLILGKSGRGKTTYMQLIGGLMKPHSGEVIIAGTSIGKLDDGARDQFRGKEIGIVFQTPHFVEALSVRENLKLPSWLIGKKFDPKFTSEILDRLALSHKMDQKIGRLSSGEKQRVALARALMNQPKLLLADEPTSALDDDNAGEVMGLLEETAIQTGTALVIVTHDFRIKNRFINQIVL